jgi:hypothetical protein
MLGLRSCCAVAGKLDAFLFQFSRIMIWNLALIP